MRSQESEKTTFPLVTIFPITLCRLSQLPWSQIEDLHRREKAKRKGGGGEYVPLCVKPGIHHPEEGKDSGCKIPVDALLRLGAARVQPSPDHRPYNIYDPGQLAFQQQQAGDVCPRCQVTALCEPFHQWVCQAAEVPAQ